MARRDSVRPGPLRGLPNPVGGVGHGSRAGSNGSGKGGVDL
jgi:hypothetical protein